MSAYFRTTRFTLLLAVAGLGSGVIAFAASSQSASASSITGTWDAVLVGKGPDIPFRLDITGDGATLKGTFYDGSRPYESTTAATFEDGKLVLDIEHYLTKITATFQDGKLVGETSLRGPEYSLNYGFRATKRVERPVADARYVPAISGSWEIPLAETSPKGEKAWRFIVEQNGANVSASILRVDGDTGALNGAFKDGKWVLSHFDGHRPDVIELTPAADGTLQIAQGNALLGSITSGDDAPAAKYTTKYVAYRSEVARAKGLPKPADYLAHTKARDSREKFTFNFPDLQGKLRSQDDPYFKGKVVIAVVTGTWCPNCHDEAQYLVELDRKYRDRGLSIVALNFEEVEQQDSQVRARAFVKQYGVKYPYLLAGAPAEMWEKVPQLVNLNSWPTTVFVGRDGTVRAVHSGFASPASGEFHAQLREQFTQQIEKLLAENAPLDTRLTAVAR
ncbi:MAG: redoxin family protein [Steroidobacteraceae bacterium]